MLRIPIRQKAKFEGWLKLELAYYIEQIGYKDVKVETKGMTSRSLTDITFFDGEHNYSVELKRQTQTGIYQAFVEAASP